MNFFLAMGMVLFYGIGAIYTTMTGHLIDVFLPVFVGGTIVLAGLIAGINVNQYKWHRDQAKKQYKRKLEDDIAFMGALYHRVHPSYQPFIQNDLYHLALKTENRAFDFDEAYIDTLYYQYMCEDLSYFARKAESVYQ